MLHSNSKTILVALLEKEIQTYKRRLVFYDRSVNTRKYLPAVQEALDCAIKVLEEVSALEVHKDE